MSGAKIVNQAAILVNRDVPAAIAYWVDRLGFEISSVYGEPVSFAILKRDGAYVMLGALLADAEITPNWKLRSGLWNAYFWVDDAKGMYEEMRGRGATIDYELCTQPYGVLEFGVQDPDGHDIAFGEPLQKSVPPAA